MKEWSLDSFHLLWTEHGVWQSTGESTQDAILDDVRQLFDHDTYSRVIVLQYYLEHVYSYSKALLTLLTYLYPFSLC